METDSGSEGAPSPAQSPEPKIPTPPPPEPSPVPEPSPAPEGLIPPMPHSPAPDSESSLPAPPPRKKYKFGPKNINGTGTVISISFSDAKFLVDGPGFGLRRKQVEIRVPRLPAELRAPPSRVPSPSPHIPSPSPSPAPPVASSSRSRKRVLCEYNFRTFLCPLDWRVFIASDEEQTSPSKSLRQASSPPRLTRQQKQKGRAVDTCKSWTFGLIC